jgi:ADP-ribose pyrophosphatase YjhB (NUDIX family)
MPGKPRIFVASSSESSSIAYAIQENLANAAEVTVWDQNAFGLNTYALETLVKALDDYEFAICVCAPSDRSEIRGEHVDVTRDNVIFEMGLFMGRHGRERCFVVQPSGFDLHLPSDIAGIMTGRFDPHRSDGNLRAALGPACNQIREQVRKVVANEARTSAENAKVRNLAAFCYRTTGKTIELLLIRTSENRWALPKGRRYPPEAIVKAVQRVGREKAGATGKVDPNPVGTFKYLNSETNREQTVSAFLLAVEQLEPVAQSFRTPTWFDIANAMNALKEDREYRYAEEFRSLVQKAMTTVREEGQRPGGAQP